MTVLQLTASAAIKKYQVVTAAGAPTSAATDEPYGVAQADAASGETFPVLVEGETKLIAADAAVADGETVMPAADGEVDTYDGAATKYRFAKVYTDADAQGDLLRAVVYAAELDAIV